MLYNILQDLRMHHTIAFPESPNIMVRGEKAALWQLDCRTSRWTDSKRSLFGSLGKPLPDSGAPLHLPWRRVA